MKKFLVLALSAAMALSMAGCRKEEPAPEVTALTCMEQINSKNIVDSTSNMRLWYQINPTLFTDKTTGEPGTLRSVVADIEYLSDNDTSTHDDLDMSGILLTSLLDLDADMVSRDLKTMNPSIGTEEDLSSLCTRANGLNMPVMITLELAAISQENEDFKRMIDLVNANSDAENLFEMDPNLFGEFYVEKDKNEDGWTRIGGTSYFYRSLPQSATPRINLENMNIRAMIEESVDYYTSLGVSGFYIPDYNDLFVNEDQKAAEFMTWFDQMVKSKNENATVVFSYSSWNDSMASIPAYAADSSSLGAEGMIAKAATGTITAKDLGSYLETNSLRTQGVTAQLINNANTSLDLLKSNTRLAQYKMALALQIMTSGQIFIACGDELGLTSEQAELIVDAIEMPAEDGEDTQLDSESDSSSMQTQVDLQFGSLSEQKIDGNSIFNFVQQAILLRDSYQSVAAGSMTMSQELSTDSLLVIDKKVSNSETVLVFNLSDKDQELDTSQIIISGLGAELGGVLLTGVENITLDGSTLHLPPYSMALLK